MQQTIDDVLSKYFLTSEMHKSLFKNPGEKHRGMQKKNVADLLQEIVYLMQSKE